MTQTDDNKMKPTQTAVEWLYKELTKAWYDEKSSLSILKKAKAMQKEQIIDAFIDGEGGYNPDNGNTERMAEDYYNKIYNK
jgi:hypothetical protein